MYMLSGFLFVDKSGFMVTHYFYPFIHDLEADNQYEWGTVALTYLYHQLGITTHAKAPWISR